MATYTYNPTGQYGATGYTLYSDKNLSIPAPVVDANGNPLPAQVQMNPDGTWPTVYATAAPLWLQDADGTKIQISPGPNYANPAVVAGSKGANAALTSLIAGLVAVGVPIIDQTT